MSGSFKSAETLSNRKNKTKLFDVAIATDPGAHQFSSADFKISEIVCVIDYPCRIGVSIENPVLGAENGILHCYFHAVLRSLSMSSKPFCKRLESSVVGSDASQNATPDPLCCSRES